mgnify:CR=1 FL=1
MAGTNILVRQKDLIAGTGISITPDTTSGNVTIAATSTAIDESRLLPTGGRNGNLLEYQEGVDRGNDVNTKLLIQPATSDGLIVDQAAGNAAPVGITNSGNVAIATNALVFSGENALIIEPDTLGMTLGGDNEYSIEVDFQLDQVKSDWATLFGGDGSMTRSAFYINSSGATAVQGGIAPNTTGWTTGTRHRLTIERFQDGDSWKTVIYRNGAVLATSVTTPNTLSGDRFPIGSNLEGTGRNFVGKIWAFRISNKAEHRGVSFTPRELPFLPPAGQPVWTEGIDRSRLLPENPANGDIPCFDATATVGGGNDANTRILLHFDADEIKDEAAGNAAPVTITKKTGTITVVEGGKWGKCAKYVTGSMTVATNLDELNANNWVVSGWFNPDENNHGVSYPTWLSMDDQNTHGFGFDSTGRYGESDGPLFYLDTPPASGTWHWLAIVKYSGGLRFYLNGAFLNEISAQQRANFCSTLAIGGYAGTYAAGSTERTFSGLVDEVRLQYIPDDEITLWTGTSIAVPDAPYSKPQTVGEWGKFNKSELVQSVNGITPDENGNVNIDSALTLDQLEYNDVPYKYQGMTIDSSSEDSNMTSRFYGKAVSTFGDLDSTATFPSFPFKPHLRDDSLVGGEADIYYELWKSDSVNTDEWNTIEFKSVNAPSKIIKISAQTAGTDACVMSYILDGLRKDGAILARIVQGKMTLPASSASNVLGDFSELNFNTNEIAEQYFDSFELKVRTEGASGDKAASGIASIKFMITEKNAAWVGINKKNLVRSINGYKPLDGAVTLPEATTSAAGLMSATDKAKLNNQFTTMTTGSIDFNQLTDVGVYFISGVSEHINHPGATAKIGGILTVQGIGVYRTQSFAVFSSPNQSVTWTRWATSDGSSWLFQNWRKHLIDLDITESKARPGYFKLPGGTIVQWGATTDLSADGTTEITLPLAFPNEAFVAIATATVSGITASAIFRGTTKLNVIAKGYTSTPFKIYWVAIGR